MKGEEDEGNSREACTRGEIKIGERRRENSGTKRVTKKSNGENKNKHPDEEKQDGEE